MVILHATTTTKVRNRPHQKTITYPHGDPPEVLQKDAELFCGGEGVIDPPLPHGDCEKILVKELLLLDWSIKNHSAKKGNRQI